MCICWILIKEFHYRVKNSSQRVPDVCQKDSVHITLNHCFKTHLILQSYLRLGLASGLFSSNFFHQNSIYVFFFYPIRTICPIISLNFISLILFVVGRAYKSPSSSLRSFLLHFIIQTTSLSFFFFSKHLRPCPLLKTKLKFPARAEQ
jgi:hypothetical protein